MGWLGRRQNFKYHWRYERDQLTNMCLANDLMIFYRVEVGTVSLFKKCIDQFRFFSSFSSNDEKSSIFFSGVDHVSKTRLFKVFGNLLVRCPGVPLITIKLTTSNCLILVDHIVTKVRCIGLLFHSFEGYYSEDHILAT
jgi:hypothetical protein